MARRILGKASGTPAGMFSADDIDYINQLLSGTDQGGADPVLMNTLFRVYDSKLRFRSTGAGTPDYTIVNPSGTAARNLTIPNVAQNDTFLMATEPATVVGKTITYADNTLTGVVGTTATQTITGKTINANDNTLQNVLSYPDKKLEGIYWGIGLGNSAVGGIFNGTTTVVGNSAGGPTSEGKWTICTSAGTTDANAGFRVSNGNAAVIGLKEPRCKIKFRLNITSNVRLWAGYQATTTEPTGDTWLDNKSAFMVSIPTAATTNFQVARNNASASTTYTDIATGAVAKDTAIHTIEIKITDAGATYQLNFDGAGWTSYTTAIPATTTSIYPVINLETTEAVAKNMDLWYVFEECLP